MWAGKIAIILYLFSVSVLFFGYYLNTYFNNPNITNTQYFGGNPYSAMSTLASSYHINQQINTSLIFGDFIAALTVIFGILTGSTISGMLSLLPWGTDTGISLLVQIVFSFSSVLLWVYIVANRSV